MSETLTIQHEATTGIRAMFGDRWCVRRGTEYVAEFIHESDARRFVAGEKAVEAMQKARHVLEMSKSEMRNEYRAGEGISTGDAHDDEIDEAIKLIDSALSTLTSEATKHE